MLFDRYGEVMARLEEMGARVGNLNNRDRQVMQNLLEEQEWLSTTLVKRAKYLLEEIDRSFEKLFDWMINFSNLIDRASGHGGTPADVLRMERMMQEADELRERLNRLVSDHEQTGGVPSVITAGSGEREPGGKTEQEPPRLPVQCLNARWEAAPASIQAEIAAEAGSPLLLPPTGGIKTIPQVQKPVAVVKKTRKKDRKKTKASGNRQKYLPPKELLSALEQKMATACRVHQTGMDSKKK